MNRSLQDVSGKRALARFPQFTPYANVSRGNRPSFDGAAPAEKARQLYEFFVEQIGAAGMVCETGRFQEMMKVETDERGPVTILLDSEKAF